MRSIIFQKNDMYQVKVTECKEVYDALLEFFNRNSYCDPKRNFMFKKLQGKII